MWGIKTYITCIDKGVNHGLGAKLMAYTNKEVWMLDKGEEEANDGLDGKLMAYITKKRRMLGGGREVIQEG